MTLLDRVRKVPMTPARLVRETMESTGSSRTEVISNVMRQIQAGPLQLCTDGYIREREIR